MLEQKHHATGDALCEYVRKEAGDTVLLAFSAGKDSVGTWLQLRRHFKTVVPYFFFQIPGISFVEDALKYYEDFFGVGIHRFPSPDLYESMENLLLQPPMLVPFWSEARMYWNFTMAAAVDWLRAKHKAPNMLAGMGYRKTDSMRRNFSITKHGSIYPHMLKFYPVFDWNDARLVRELKGEGVKLAVDYRFLYRTFEGPRHAQLEAVRDNFPRDYERILRWYPLAPADAKRREFYEAEGLEAQYAPELDALAAKAAEETE